MSAKDEEKMRIPIAVAPPEIFELYSKLNEMDRKIDLVLSEVARREGLRLGSHIGFFYGFLTGSLIILILKFVLKAL